MEKQQPEKTLPYSLGMTLDLIDDVNLRRERAENMVPEELHPFNHMRPLTEAERTHDRGDNL